MGSETKSDSKLSRVKQDGITIGSQNIPPESLWGWIFISPVIFLYILVALVPILFGIYASFHQVPLFNPVWEFIGLENYSIVLNDNEFWASLWRGVVYMIGSTILQLIIGVWMALVINRLARGQRFLSALVFSVYLIPTIIVTLVSLYLVDPSIGPIPPLLDFLGVWSEAEYLLGTPELAMPLVIIISSWKFSVFMTILVIAQLRGIPSQFYEAAKICGATQYEMFRDVTLPRIKGAIFVAVFLRSIFMFNKFDLIWMLTSGGPGKQTQTLPIMAYRTTFIEGFFGQGNTIAVFMFLFLLAGGIGYFYVFNPSAEVETEV